MACRRSVRHDQTVSTSIADAAGDVCANRCREEVTQQLQGHMSLLSGSAQHRCMVCNVQLDAVQVYACGTRSNVAKAKCDWFFAIAQMHETHCTQVLVHPLACGVLAVPA